MKSGAAGKHRREYIEPRGERVRRRVRRLRESGGRRTEGGRQGPGPRGEQGRERERPRAGRNSGGQGAPSRRPGEGGPTGLPRVRGGPVRTPPSFARPSVVAHIMSLTLSRVLNAALLGCRLRVLDCVVSGLPEGIPVDDPRLFRCDPPLRRAALVVMKVA